MPRLWQPPGTAPGAAIRPKAIVPSEGVVSIIPNSKTATIREISRSMKMIRTMTSKSPYLCPCDFDAKFFWQTLADFFRQTVVHALRSLLGGV